MAVLRMPLVSERPTVHANGPWHPCEQVVPWRCWAEPLPSEESAFASAAAMRYMRAGMPRQLVMGAKHWGFRRCGHHQPPYCIGLCGSTNVLQCARMPPIALLLCVRRG